MNQNDPLIPRTYARLAVASAIVLALFAGGIWIGNYAFTLIQEHQREAAAEVQQAAAQAKAEADQRAAEQHAQWLNETVAVTVDNHSSVVVALWTATPNGTNADGSTIWAYNAACSAFPGQSCSSRVYDHHGILITAHSGSPYLANNATWHWGQVPENDLSIPAYNL